VSIGAICEDVGLGKTQVYVLLAGQTTYCDVAVRAHPDPDGLAGLAA
jgi:hypothetical protein